MAKYKKPAILTRETLQLYWQQVRVDKRRFWIMAVCIPLASLVLDTAVPYLLAQAIGTYASSDSSNMFHFLLTASIAAIAGVCLNLIGYQMAVRHEAAVRTRLNRSALSVLLKKDQEFFANQKIGSLTGKFIDFVNGHVGIQDLLILQTISFIINVAVGLTIIATHTWSLAGVIFLLIIGLIIQVRVFRRMREPIRAERKKLISEVNGAVADTISNNLTVMTFAGEELEVKRAEDISKQYERAYVKDFRWQSIEGSGRIMFMQAFQIGAIVLVGVLLLNNAMSLAIAIFIVAYLQRLSAQLFNLGSIINGYDKILLQATPMTEMLLESPKVSDSSDASLEVTHGDINFKDINYAYGDDKSNKVLKDFNLHIPAGQRIGLVGVSGAGKTTLTKLLLRFDDITEGTITIDGQDIANINQQSLRKSIAYVAQEPLLFHRSLAENIAYGKPDATLVEVSEAARRAHALSFIMRMPKAFETIVGERGIKLSGGQRQRVAIARAILKDAPILVLDEATSALDSESEKLIQSSLESLMKNRTSIVIAHRLSTIAKLDRIIVLDEGTIIEDGTHAQLIQNSGVYASLWNHQSGGFIDSEAV